MPALPTYTHSGQTVSGIDACTIQLYNGGAVDYKTEDGFPYDMTSCWEFHLPPDGSPPGTKGTFEFVPNVNNYVDKILENY